MNIRSFEEHRCRMARYFVNLLSSIVGAAFLAFPAGSAFAAESGSSFYLLGQRSQSAAVLPPEGLFFSVPSYFYSGDIV